MLHPVCLKLNDLSRLGMAVLVACPAQGNRQACTNLLLAEAHEAQVCSCTQQSFISVLQVRDMVRMAEITGNPDAAVGLAVNLINEGQLDNASQLIEALLRQSTSRGGRANVGAHIARGTIRALRRDLKGVALNTISTVYGSYCLKVDPHREYYTVPSPCSGQTQYYLQ